MDAGGKIVIVASIVAACCWIREESQSWRKKGMETVIKESEGTLVIREEGNKQWEWWRVWAPKNDGWL